MRHANKCLLLSGLFAVFAFVWAVIGFQQYLIEQILWFSVGMTAASLNLIASVLWLLELNDEANRYYEKDKQ